MIPPLALLAVVLGISSLPAIPNSSRVNLRVLLRPAAGSHHRAHAQQQDVGWLKTVDEYYYGVNNTIQDARVQYILDTAVACLTMNPARKFIYVEIAFFSRWWAEQTDAMKATVRSLVKSGQLEFINGGWCMNDEGTTDYESIIDQMTFGHQFLLNEFGVVPRIGWHVDPFGHSATQASLFAQMGFDAFFIYRIDYQDWLQRNATQNLEFIWRGSQSLGASSEIWTHVLDLNDGYCCLPTFDFESGMSSDPIMDDPRLEGYNVQQRADEFAALVRNRAASVKHSHILVPFGCDFRYQNAFENFKNIDKLTAYINANPGRYNMSVFYSTPSLYADAVAALNLTWTTKTDDFFPYSQFPHAYWAGYFTSRTTFKGFVRSRKALYHAATKLLAIASPVMSPSTFNDSLTEIAAMDDAFGIAQHHDAVSGTAKQHVTDDYELRLQVGTDACSGVLSSVISQIYTPKIHSSPPDFSFCPFLNESICPAFDALPDQTIAVVMYNPLGWWRFDWVILYGLPKVPNLIVYNSSGANEGAQLSPNKDNSSLYDLAFQIAVPPLGYATYFLRPMPADHEHADSTKFAAARDVDQEDDEAPNFVLQSAFMTVEFESSTGLMALITNRMTNTTIAVQQGLWWYNASAGYNAPDDGTSHWNQASGAYMLRTNSTNLYSLAKKPTMSIVAGPYYQELRQVWNDWAMQVVRLYMNEPHMVIETTVGPIDISDNLGKEVISRFYTSINSSTNGAATWWADSEGGEMQQRILNQRLSFQVNVTEQIGGNYYPMDNIAYICDNTTGVQLTWLTDRARGCSAQGVGQLEAMLHRRLLYDDDQGVGEPLNESTIARAVSYVALSPAGNDTALWQRSESILLNHPVQLMFATVPSSMSIDDWVATYESFYQPWRLAYVPPTVHLITYAPFNGSASTILIRLGNILPASEGGSEQEIDLENFAPPGCSWSTIRETTLTANANVSASKRLHGTVVALSPLQIRTFVATFEKD